MQEALLSFKESPRFESCRLLLDQQGADLRCRVHYRCIPRYEDALRRTAEEAVVVGGAGSCFLDAAAT